MSGVTPWQPRPRQWWGLGLALALATAPHLLRLPLWLTGIWLLAVGWRISLGLQGQPMPALGLRLLLTLAAAVALYLNFGTVVGRESSSALLVMMVGLKLLELKRHRDAILLILLGYLLLAIQFLFNQSVVGALYAVLAGLGITSVWLVLSNPIGARSWRADLWLAARMLGQAVPLMGVLFVLFPRLPGPLWSLPSDAHGAHTGLSGDMEPGRISRLALSPAVAFRADFEGALPAPAQRYWRGPVFEMTDGRRWWGISTERIPATEMQLPFQPLGTAFRYVLTLEPSSSPWLPALEMTTTVPADAERLPTLELRARRTLDALRRDTFIAFPDYRITTLDTGGRARNLRVPAALSARVLQLARDWREVAHNDLEVVQAALQHFNTQPFVYTLEPPLLGSDPVDEFLFETRHGFCEHYAAAFTILMRAAGIPTRVVTGYQGGEVNPVGDYLIVRQSDAHAWAEVWLAETGWTRVDPTAAVAPERIERGIDPGLAYSGDAGLFQFDERGILAQTLRRARFAFDALDNGWNQWVLSYGPERQREVFSGLGMHDVGWRDLAWMLLLGIGITLGALALVLLRRRRPRRDPAARFYAHFRRRLRRYGLQPEPQEGPRDLLARIEQAQLPAIAAARQITELYIRLRYAPQPDTTLLHELRRAVRTF